MYGNDHLRLCCKNQAWTEGVRDVALPQTSSRLEVEPFTDDCEGLRERSGTDAKSALDDARLAADVLCEVEDRRLALAYSIRIFSSLTSAILNLSER